MGRTGGIGIARVGRIDAHNRASGTGGGRHSCKNLLVSVGGVRLIGGVVMAAAAPRSDALGASGAGALLHYFVLNTCLEAVSARCEGGVRY